MSESIDERRGPKRKIVPISYDLADEIEAAGGPMLYHYEAANAIYADAAELEKWRKARTDSQAGVIHE